MTFLAIVPRAIPPQTFRPASDDAVPLRWGGLCVGCEVVYDLRRPCPYCGASEAVNLSRVLGTEAA